MPARSNNLVREATLRVSSSRRKRRSLTQEAPADRDSREGFTIQLAVVDPVVPDLIGEVAAQKAPYFF